ncbi:MAG: HNH endonuclease [Acidobacteria bacterium]|nr:HNH endonuclease [Acidobacteriota bacterium]
MNTWLLTWNPDRSNWDIDSYLSLLREHGFFDASWSCGNTKRIERGDRIFLLRQGVEPRGIMASGQALARPDYDDHWDEDRDDQILYVNVRFDTLLAPEEDGVLPLEQLQNGLLGEVNWSTRTSGISIEPRASALLEDLWYEFLEERGQAPALIPEEIPSPAQFFEGASRTISVNAYERNGNARKACIEHYGESCVVCGFNFAAKYGDLGEGFIHVHHVVPLSQIGKETVVDPVKHLRPVCPNCHAMLHRQKNVLSIEELKRLLAKNDPG